MAYAFEGDQTAASGFCSLLSDVLDDLVGEVDDSMFPRKDRVKQALLNISKLYQTGLGKASTNFRTDWNDPVNRCAYVFLYLMHHCSLVHFSLQNSDVCSSLKKNNLRVCSVGGGPGSDIIGVTSFLRDNGLLSSSLNILVLDKYPRWKDTWDKLHRHMQESLNVTYKNCDLVKQTSLPDDVRRFISQADLLTFIKSFSAVSAFFRNDANRGRRLRDILRLIKPGCLVLYIDNKHDRDTQFMDEFAIPAGLSLLWEVSEKPVLPRCRYPSTIQNYISDFDYRPMTSCEVKIQIFCKKGPLPLGTPNDNETGSFPPSHVRSTSQVSSDPSHAAVHSSPPAIPQPHQRRQDSPERVNRSSLWNTPAPSPASETKKGFLPLGTPNDNETGSFPPSHVLSTSQVSPDPSHAAVHSSPRAVVPQPPRRRQDTPKRVNRSSSDTYREPEHREPEGLSVGATAVLIGVGIGALLLIGLLRK